MRTLSLLLAVAIIMLAAVTANAQTPANPQLYTFGVSPNLVELDDMDAYDVTSNGLPNVAPGAKVYLRVGGAYARGTANGNGSEWSTVTFNMIEMPAGSAASLTTFDNGMKAWFIPDVEGTYTIEIMATDDVGESGTDQLKVNVASYVGVGTIVDPAGTPTPPQCGACHTELESSWAATGHGTVLETRIDEAGGHFAEHCLPCHTTGSTNPAAMGSGWLDLQKSSSWTFPATLEPGNYAALLNDYPDLAKMANVQCESCHGPGGATATGHGFPPTQDNKIVTDVTSEQCKQCHDSPPYHRTVEEFENSGHSVSVGDPSYPWHMNRGSQTSRNSDCARCHTSAGYLDVFHSEQDPATGFTNAPYDTPGYVGCVTCHDPHNDDNDHQLRKPATDLCADCHSIRVSGHSGLHHSHQGPMLKGFGGREFDGYTYESSTHSNIAELCASCHMEPPADDQYQNKMGGHTFSVSYDNDTPDDESDDVLNEAGCIGCHAGGITIQDVRNTQEEFMMLLDQLEPYLKKDEDGDIIYPGSSELTALEDSLVWNYLYVANDNSYGVHNPKYARALLESAIAEAQKLAIEPVDGSIPGSYNLAQNYPNPFNPSTKIRFSLPVGNDVVVRVFNSNGELVSTLVNSRLNAGTYDVEWHGTNMNSGVYFYTIEAGTYTATKKMVLVK